MASTYGWLITRDHLGEEDNYEFGDARGVTGPSNMSEDMGAKLAAGAGRTFRMYDDDGILYYSGKAILPSMDSDDFESGISGPLRDYGRPAAGAVLIKWHGQPDWTCEA